MKEVANKHDAKMREILQRIHDVGVQTGVKASPTLGDFDSLEDRLQKYEALIKSEQQQMNESVGLMSARISGAENGNSCLLSTPACGV